MGNTTNSQGLRYPYVDEGINSTNIANLAADCATALDAQDVSRNLMVKRPIAAVQRFAGQSIAVNTDTTVIWDSINLDPNSMVNLATFPTRITVPSTATGLWRVSMSGPLSVSWTRLTLSFMVSGVVRAMKTVWGSDATWPMFSTFINVPNAGDYIELRVRHAGGGTDSFSTNMTAVLAAKT